MILNRLPTSRGMDLTTPALAPSKFRGFGNSFQHQKPVIASREHGVSKRSGKQNTANWRSAAAYAACLLQCPHLHLDAVGSDQLPNSRSRQFLSALRVEALQVPRTVCSDLCFQVGPAAVVAHVLIMVACRGRRRVVLKTDRAEVHLAFVDLTSLHQRGEGSVCFPQRVLVLAAVMW